LTIACPLLDQFLTSIQADIYFLPSRKSIMNSKLIAATVIALSSLGATAAFADTFEVIAPNTASSTTRTEVMAQYAKARADGTLQGSNEIGQFTAAERPAASNLTRAEVQKEGVKALAARTNYSVSLSPSRM
jgi:Domain of unknown function (DUF4148)